MNLGYFRSYCIHPPTPVTLLVDILDSSPLTSSTPGSDEDRDAEHGSGCARSEGFYTISRTEKLKNLNNARLAPEPPATSALVAEPHVHTFTQSAGTSWAPWGRLG